MQGILWLKHPFRRRLACDENSTETCGREGRRDGGRWLSSPSLYQASGSFALLSSCLLSFPFPQSPLPLKEFSFSLTVAGVPKRLLATPAAGLAAQPPPRGRGRLEVPGCHRAPPVPARAWGTPGTPGAGPGCSSSLQLQSLRRWGWSSSWGGLWAWWALPGHL